MEAKGSMLKGALSKFPKSNGNPSSLPANSTMPRQNGGNLTRFSPGMYRNTNAQTANPSSMTMQEAPATRPPAPLGTPPGQSPAPASEQNMTGTAPLGQQMPSAPSPAPFAPSFAFQQLPQPQMGNLMYNYNGQQPDPAEFMQMFQQQQMQQPQTVPGMLNTNRVR